MQASLPNSQDRVKERMGCPAMQAVIYVATCLVKCRDALLQKLVFGIRSVLSNCCLCDCVLCIGNLLETLSPDRAFDADPVE